MKKGFTLIELLAVIVILAIIALIATPIILNIINDTKESANERSAELYYRAVENAVANYRLNEPTDSNLTYDKIDDYIKYDGAKVTPETLIIYPNGDIYATTFKIGDSEEIIKDQENKNVEYGTRPVCIGATASTKTTGEEPKGNFDIGDEYICEVKEGVEYHFFVLSVNKDADGNMQSVDLIMAQNIGADGNALTLNSTIEERKAGKISWNSTGNTTSGPVTAINYLNNATSSWNRISNMNYTYKDEKYEVTFTGKARLPIYKKGQYTELGKYEKRNGAKCDGGTQNCELWAVDYLHNIASYSNYSNGTSLPEVYGYWTLGSYNGGTAEQNNTHAWYVSNGGRVYGEPTTSGAGIRPVIRANQGEIFE